MALEVRSTLVTAPSSSKVMNYIPKIPSSVNGNNLNVDKKAVASYNEILKSYNNMKKYFEQLSTEFKNTKKNVVGEKLKNSLNKIANQCSNQGKYCQQRRQNLIESFQYASLEQRIDDLEEAMAKFNI